MRFAPVSDNFNVVQRRVLDQFGDQDCVMAQDGLDLLRGGIAATNPDDFGWCSVKPAALCEVTVLGDDAKVVRLRVFPDLIIGGLVEPGRANVCGIRKQIREPGGQPVTEVLVKQELHAAEPTRWWSRSAA